MFGAPFWQRLGIFPGTGPGITLGCLNRLRGCFAEFGVCNLWPQTSLTLRLSSFFQTRRRVVISGACGLSKISPPGSLQRKNENGQKAESGESVIYFTQDAALKNEVNLVCVGE